MVYRVAPSHTVQFLESVDIFRGLTGRDLERVAALCQEWTFSAGDSLGVQNEPGAGLYIVRNGEVTATHESPEKSVVVRTMKPREAFPVAVLFDPPILVTTTHAATDGDGIVIPGSQLRELFELEPRVGMHVYRAVCGILAGRYRHTLERFARPPSR